MCLPQCLQLWFLQQNHYQFDEQGQECFWTVTSDQVRALTFCDVDGDGNTELLVGCDDAELRVYRQEDVVSESTETDAIIRTYLL